MATKQAEKPPVSQKSAKAKKSVKELLAGAKLAAPAKKGTYQEYFERLVRRLGGRKVAMAVVVCMAALALCLASEWNSGAEDDPALRPGPAPTAPATAAPTETLSATTAPTPTAQPTAQPTPTSTPEPTPTAQSYDFAAPVPEREAVENDYFADAVFIGDSRTDGLRLYSGIKGSHFLYYTGVTVFDVASRDSKLLEADGEKISFLEALEKRQYAKIYIMLGINELGYPDSSAFRRVYGQLIDKLQEIQPDAVIYIQGLIPVNEERCKSHGQPDYITNKKIAKYSALLAELAEEKRVAYVDAGAGLVDENGLLPADKTSDGIHFKRSGYVEWLDYLKTHTVDETAYRQGREAEDEEREGADET